MIYASLKAKAKTGKGGEQDGEAVKNERAVRNTGSTATDR
jgi:hypothetical protein